jgi:ABC-type glycerol-3-phosphate transport system permease component
MGARLGRGLLATAGAVLLVVVFAGPVAWAALSAFKGHTDIALHPWGLPRQVSWANYQAAWQGGMGTYLVNSAVITVLAVALVLVVSAPAAYAFARLRFRADALLLGLVISGLLVPVHAVLVPLYQWNPGTLALKWLVGLLPALGWVVARWGEWVAVIGPYVAFGIPLTVLLLRAYFAGIPKELTDAAQIDGCGHLRTLSAVMLPVARPALATVAIFQASWIWNELVLAMVFINDPRQRTLTIGLMGFQGEHATDWGVVLAGVMMAVVPVLALYLAFQRHIIKGLTAGAVK